MNANDGFARNTKRPCGAEEKKMTSTLTHCTIYLDAGFDLYQAGIDQDMADDYTESYTAAADYLGELLGIDITVDAPPCSQYGGLDGNHVESEQWAQDAEVWQSLHSSLYQDEAGEWQYDERKIEGLAKRITR